MWKGIIGDGLHTARQPLPAVRGGERQGSTRVGGGDGEMGDMAAIRRSLVERKYAE